MDLFEIKTVLRSILTSSSVGINVSQLNKEFMKYEGSCIPFKKLGHNSLLGFFKSIPDVLLVKGDSCYSEVTLVESTKSSHVRDLVLGQKSSIARNYSDGCRPTKTYFKKDYHRAPKSSEMVSFNDILTKKCSTKFDDVYVKHDHLTSKMIKNKSEGRKSRRDPEPIRNYGDSRRQSNLRATVTDKDSRDGISEPNSDKCIVSSSIQLEHKTKSTGHQDLLNEWLNENVNRKIKEQKYESRKEGSYRLNKQEFTDDSNERKTEMDNVLIPKELQNNLQQVISDYPDGLWSADLPTVYKEFTGKDLRFEKYGYKSLRFLCYDLGNIFHCITESSSDIKLYDARKPFPKINVVQEESAQDLEESSLSELPPAIPDMCWGGFDSFIPQDAIKLEFEIHRIQVADIFDVGVRIKVVVADIYDISKFWIYLDDSKLITLFSKMQDFYKNNERYLVPKSLLEAGLHCVVLYNDEFHRAVILEELGDEDNLKVFYFDFGTLGKVSKTQVWFLSHQFSELPAQAIRARLADIRPTYDGAIWSQQANAAFSTLTLMEKMTAKIVRIDKRKNTLEIKLKNEKDYISDILVNRDHAVFNNTTPKQRIEDPNCQPRVKYMHFFPTFEEIENWLVPSKQEFAEFLKTPVTADLLYSQYFIRPSHIDMINSIEERMRKALRRNKGHVKSLKHSQMLHCQSMEDMNKIAYGESYEPEVFEMENEYGEDKSWLEENDERISRRLGKKNFKKSYY